MLWRRDMWAGSGVELSKVDWVWMMSPFRKSTTVKPYTHPTAILRENEILHYQESLKNLQLFWSSITITIPFTNYAHTNLPRIDKHTNTHTHTHPHTHTARCLQSLVPGEGEGGRGDIGKEVHAVGRLVPRLTLHSASSEGERSLPIAAPLTRVVPHYRHPHQL